MFVLEQELRVHEAADARAREYEAYALKALETGEETIGRKCAEVVASAEAERDAAAGIVAPGPHTADAVLARLRRRIEKASPAFQD